MMKWLKHKTVFMLLIIASLCFTLTGSAFAFSDIKGDKEQAAIESLEKKGIVSGNGKGKFSPKGELTVAGAVALIVKGMELNLNHIRFIKEPKASDYFTKVKDDAWYAQAFIIASVNGLDIPKDIDPNAKSTREQFAHWLYNAIKLKGDFAWTEMYFSFQDEKQVDSAYMNSIQRLLNGKIAKLDDKNNFRPKQPITRSEAAGMLHRAIEFVKVTPPIEPVDPEMNVLKDVKLTSESLNGDLLKVTISAMAPHPGYGIEIAGIDFHGDRAIVRYRLILPDPAAMYAQVVTEVKATTYVSAAFKPELGFQEPAESRKQETADGTKIIPLGSGSDSVETQHRVRNPDASTSSSEGSSGAASGF
ncbi:S-layer homology domain-containing protein [Cohnella sp. CFH 77786]|uniref:S-layer homology domain-containing protein n=1 Tax=Cohnella sp. CFH 77786 TaxID=2662265 RepID=UPI001C60EF46|nr:S-layer homology domain-containing protein [Cohnella sp. CFH 77786]MBW5444739.1 S-layer homology domain-containing protein [Cohnella sp. CFH 77786]